MPKFWQILTANKWWWLAEPYITHPVVEVLVRGLAHALPGLGDVRQ
jgi:hypothetical protein